MTIAKVNIAEGLDPALLDAVDVFAGLDAVGRGRALDAVRWIKLAAGNQVFRQDEDADAFYILTVGRLKMSQVTPNGQERPKEIFGCVAVCGGIAYPATATAVLDSWALGWTRGTIATLAQNYPQIALNAMRTMGGRLSFPSLTPSVYR